MRRQLEPPGVADVRLVGAPGLQHAGDRAGSASTATSRNSRRREQMTARMPAAADREHVAARAARAAGRQSPARAPPCGDSGARASTRRLWRSSRLSGSYGSDASRAQRTERLLVGGDRLAPAPLPGELPRHRRRAPRRQRRAPRGSRSSASIARPAPRVARGHEHDAPAGGGDLLWAVLAVAADRRHPAGHRLDVGDAERLGDARQHEQRAGARLGHRLRGLEAAPQTDAVSDPERACAGPQSARARDRRRRSHSAASAMAVASSASAAITSAWRLRATRLPTVTRVGCAGGSAGRRREVGRRGARLARRGRPAPRTGGRSRRCWRARAARARGVVRDGRAAGVRALARRPRGPTRRAARGRGAARRRRRPGTA